ncbi:MAG: hypothetical protein A6F70_05090 [Cycloclasticus sp. symbiont of Bathymodiolus heckerae]|nr:MAG: hypothetical protein A6F70_05090 [Cycloclasticus sp. symbiont of Bathymodiolus heckerae]
MQNKNVMMSVLLVLLLSAGGAQAAKPESNVGSKAQHSESFWDKWFSRGERVDDSDYAEDARREEKKSKDRDDKREQKSNRYFSDVERSRIADYYRSEQGEQNYKKGKKNKKKQLPPGLQKKLARGGQLPPGWQTKMARGEVLDGEILRNSELIPDELARRLPVLRDGEEIRRVGDRVVRVLEGNGTVIDVIDLADILLR